MKGFTLHYNVKLFGIEKFPFRARIEAIFEFILLKTFPERNCQAQNQFVLMLFKSHLLLTAA